MKPSCVIFGFIAGAAVASVIWCVFLVRCQIEMAAMDVSMAYGEAKISERILSYVDHPDPATAHLLIFSSSNHITGFPSEVDWWDKRYPYMHLKRRSAPMLDGLQIFLQTNNVIHMAKQQLRDTPP